MALRWTASSGVLSRTTNLPGDQNFTAMLWYKISVDTDQFHVIWLLGNADVANGFAALEISSDGLTTRFESGKAGVYPNDTGSTLTLGQWNHLCYVRDGSSHTCYVNGVVDATFTDAQTWTPTVMQLGHATFQPNAVTAAVKIYSASLTVTEVQNEMRQYTPHRTADLNLWSPMYAGANSNELLDESGNGRDWPYSGGSWTEEDGPPIPWRQGRHRSPIVVPTPTPQAGAPLRVFESNSRYLTKNGVTGFVAAGSHTWNSMLDMGNSGFPPPAFDFETWADSLAAKGHTFVRLWTWDYSRFELSTGVWSVAPLPFRRTGPGTASDGGDKFDLTLYDLDWEARLRDRILYLANLGIYCSVMLFEGWSAAYSVDAWRANGHPFCSGNNINGIAGDLNADGTPLEIYLCADNAILNIQAAYVRRVLDLVTDLPTVVIEICNEGGGASAGAAHAEWQQHWINFVHAYEAAHSGVKHLVWRVPNGTSSDETSTVVNSGAEIGSPSAWWTGYSTTQGDVPVMGAINQPRIIDDDHMGTPTELDPDGVWKIFTRGYAGVVFMDDPLYPSGLGVIAPNAATRDALGHIAAYGHQMALQSTVPNGALSSTGYCLANVPDHQYLVFQPSSGAFTLDLSAAPSVLFQIEWRNTNNGDIDTGLVPGGASAETLTPPFVGVSGVVAFLSPVVVTAGKSIWQLTELTTAELTDLLVAVDAPGSSPVTKKMAVSALATLTLTDVVRQVFISGSGTYTPTSGMKKVLVIAVGGGGTGAGGVATDSAGGGGGGGGTCIKLFTAAEIGASQPYAVGAAGNPTTLGTAGALLNAGAGGNGTAGSQGGGLGLTGAGGVGGTATGGDLNIPGTPGEPGVVYSGTDGSGGQGGSSVLGFGGRSSGTNTAGNAGTNYGGGGGGGHASGTPDRAGASGASGCLMFLEFIAA